MNVQAQDLEPINGVEPPQLGPVTIDEYINSEAPIELIEDYEGELEDFYMSWNAGARNALKN